MFTFCWVEISSKPPTRPTMKQPLDSRMQPSFPLTLWEGYWMCCCPLPAMVTLGILSIAPWVTKICVGGFLLQQK